MVKARALQIDRLLVSTALCVTMLLASSAALAGEAAVKVDNARIRWLAGSLPLAGYFTLTNKGPQTVKLIGANGPAFRRIMLHRSITENGSEKMVMVKSVAVKPGQQVRFAPGGYHLMMWRLEPVKPGETTPVTLKFANGDTKNVTFHVHGPATE